MIIDCGYFLFQTYFLLFVYINIYVDLYISFRFVLQHKVAKKSSKRLLPSTYILSDITKYDIFLYVPTGFSNVNIVPTYICI